MKLHRFFSLLLTAAMLAALCVPAAAEEEIHIEAKAATLMDAETGTVLYSQNGAEQLDIASVTKVMTALLVIEAVDRGQLKMEQMITASPAALMGLPSDGSNADPALVAGEEMSVRDLLCCVLLVSANEACNVLAEAVSGTVADFVEAMNSRAASLGCRNTHFTNTNGLTAQGHYASSDDLAVICRCAMENPIFADLCSNTIINIAPTNKCDKTRTLHTTNSLLDNWRYMGYRYAYANGIKTGTTEAAGHCLAASATKNGRTLISVVLGAEVAPDGKGGTDIQSFTESVRLLEWGFANFSTKTVITAEELIQEVPVTLSKEANYVVVHPAQTATAVLPNDVDPAELERVVTLYAPEVEAPVTAGDELGSITLRFRGSDIVTVPLLAVSDVSASRFLVVKHQVLDFLSRTVVRVSIVAAAVLVIAFAVWWKVFRRKRRYGRAVDKRYHHRSYRGRRF
ncbi:MAG: D-alanyl-D-alanine carboxypeptidase [Oscillospiraceae bacterium]|nr:D-alanyl-D-alanine carboxypeptidase [Oscillospiraceae bacterium]